MVDRIDKALLKMTTKQMSMVLEVIQKLKEGKLQYLAVKKLKRKDHVYRVRKGKYRLIFYMENRDQIRFINLESRSDTTHRD